MDYTRARYNDDLFYSDISYLRDLINRPNAIKMVDAELAIYNNMTKIEIKRFVDTYHRYTIGYDKGKELYYSSYPGNWRKRVYAKTEDDLYRRLYDIYATDKTLRTRHYLIGDLFDDAIQWIKKAQNKQQKTLDLHVADFNKYFRNIPLAETDIRDVDIHTLYKAYVTITQDGQMTQKRFRDVSVCISYVYEYAQYYCKLNVQKPQSSIFKKLKFRPDDGRTDEIKTRALTTEQIQRLREYCVDGPQKTPRKFRDRIIRFRTIILWNVFIGLRYEELCGLRWTDITKDNKGIYTVHVRGTRQNDGSWTPSTKKHTDEGKRDIDMIPYAGELYEQIRTTADDDDYFIRINSTYDGERQAYLRECKRAFAYALGLNAEKDRELLKHYTTHTPRCTCITALFEGGANDRQVQAQAGHTTINMSRMYWHNSSQRDAVRQLQQRAFEQILPEK